MKTFLLVGLILISYSFNVKGAVIDTNQILSLIEEAEEIEYQQPLEALKKYNHTFQESKKIGFYDGMVKSLMYAGLVHSNIAAYDSALIYYEKTRKILQEADDLNHAKVLGNIGNAYMFKGELEQSIAHHLSGIKYFEVIKANNYLESAYANVGAVFGQLDNFDKQIEYLQKSLSVTAKENYESLGLTHGDLGMMYAQIGEYDDAKLSFEKSDSLSKLIKSPMLDFFVMRNWSEYYLAVAEFNAALIKCEAALILAKELNLTYYEKEILMALGQIHTELKNYSNAELYYIEALKTSKLLGVIELPKKILFNLADLSMIQGDYKKAHQYLSAHMVLKDSLLNIELISETTELEAKYQSEKKDKEILEQQLQLQKNKMQTNLMVGIICFLLLSAILSYSLFRQRQQRKNKEIEVLKKEQKLKTLESLMEGEERERLRIAQELHDGVNGDLSAVKFKLNSLLETNTKAINEVIEMIDSSCEQVRTISHNLVPPSLKNFDLIQAVQGYCSDLNDLHPQTISFQQIGDEIKLSKKKELNVLRIIQELVANSLKHADAEEVTVQLSSQGKLIHITIEDDGKGFDSQQTKGKGIGLANVRSRIDYLDGQLDFNSDDNGTSYNIELEA